VPAPYLCVTDSIAFQSRLAQRSNITVIKQSKNSDYQLQDRRASARVPNPEPIQLLSLCPYLAVWKSLLSCVMLELNVFLCQQPIFVLTSFTVILVKYPIKMMIKDQFAFLCQLPIFVAALKKAQQLQQVQVVIDDHF